jgi:hypothetical protein
MSSPNTQLVDALGAIDSLIHTMKIIFDRAFNGEGEDYCAVVLLADLIKDEVAELHQLVEHMPEAAR